MEEFKFGEISHSPRMDSLKAEWEASRPFRHVVIDDFLPDESVEMLSGLFPLPESSIWLDWKKRSSFQYGKQAPGNSDRFGLLPPRFLSALHEFNNWRFLQYLENITSIFGLIPDPYFTGGGIHQILQGGILDIHTDSNYYGKLSLFRRINVLLYLTLEWRPEYGGCLELWSSAPQDGGACFREIPPIANRLVIFETDKRSYHGHPREWSAPDGIYRRSVALYYYTSQPAPGKVYDETTNFVAYVNKKLPLV